MKWFVFIAALVLGAPAFPQDVANKKKQQQVTHKKPTPEQIRRFKELEKKQKKA